MEIMFYESPIGLIKLEAYGDNITYVGFTDELTAEPKPVNSGQSSGVLAACALQLDEYFAGERKTFDLGINLRGTEFRVRVWNELLHIPYGETRSYKDISAALGKHNSSRAVGGANHHNPISIIVPCHRVIGADGGLTGYGGGLWRKEWLLSHETKH